MPDVYISYARSDRKRVAAIVEALEGAGFSCWWDPAVKQEVLRERFQGALAVIVCWSRASAKSDPVLTEANQAYNLQKLVPITLQGCDPPMPFNMVPSADLTKWRGEPDDEYWVDTLAEVRRLVDKGRKSAAFAPPPAPAAPTPAPPPAPAPRARKTAPPARQQPPPEPAGRAPRYQASRKTRKSGGAGKFVGGAIVAAAVLGGVVWAGPEAFRYIENKLANPQQTAAIDPALAPPLITEPMPAPVSAIPVVVDEPKPASAAPPRVVAVKPPVQAKPATALASVAPSVRPPSIVAPPASVAPPKAMASMENVEACLRQVARLCDASTSDFRTDGQFSVGERKLMATAMFPDGAVPTEDNLATCKAGATRRAMNTETGKAVCVALKQP